MIDKYRVHEVAKDLGVPSKDVVNLLAKFFPDSPKGHMSALERNELSVVFEQYSTESQIADVDAFFAQGKLRREAEEKEAAAQAQAKPAAPEPKPEPEPIAVPKPVEKPVSVQATAPPKPAQTPAQTPARPAQPKPPVSVAKVAPQQEKPRTTPSKPPQKRQTTAITQGRTTQGTPTVQTTAETDATNRVDLRTVQVNLDKYNEKYEKIAPTTAPQQTRQKEQDARKRKDRRKGRDGRPILSRQEKDAQRKKHQEMEKDRRQNLIIQLPVELSVADLADRLKIQVSEIVRRLMVLGVMAAAGEMIDYDTAAMVAMEIGAKAEPEVVVTLEDRLFQSQEVSDENLVSRPPVVVVMGHVDHGKTSTLDAIRQTRVTSGEAGGITQHIGAYQIEAKDGRKLTFLDTPGHAAFTSMRSRGAQVTDIAIIVVAADDGIMPQTVEAINHAKAANVNIIVAINKIDKPDANPGRVMQELTQYGIVPEEWGGDTIVVNISAVTGEGLDTLVEMVQLTADILELKSNPDRNAIGTVIEARVDKGRGAVATLLVQNGTLHVTNYVIAGSTIGRVRAMLNERGETLEFAGPSTPVEIIGLSEVPLAGDTFHAVTDERLARELVDRRKHEAKEEQFSSYTKVTLENLFDQISEGEMKELLVIIKADVQGSVEAIKQSLEKLTNEEVRVRVIHGGVGAVNESDVMLAESANAIIVAFNVRPDNVARDRAKRDSVDMRMYRVIYDAIDEIKDAIKGMLAPKFRDIDLGSAEVREVFKVTNIGTVAGSYVTNGKITRSAEIRVVRDGVIIADDKISSLRRFKDDVKEVAQNYECGIGLEKFNDLKVGDILEAYIVEEYRD